MSTFILKCKVCILLPDMQINHISFNLEMHLKFTTVVVLVSLERKEKKTQIKIKSLIDEGGKRHQMKFGTLALTLHTTQCAMLCQFSGKKPFVQIKDSLFFCCARASTWRMQYVEAAIPWSKLDPFQARTPLFLDMIINEWSYRGQS